MLQKLAKVAKNMIITNCSTVMIDHQDGFLSVYANNSQGVVRLGDSVNKGDTVAKAKSGKDRFLYFEIRRKGEAGNPLFYLPKF